MRLVEGPLRAARESLRSAREPLRAAGESLRSAARPPEGRREAT